MLALLVLSTLFLGSLADYYGGSGLSYETHLIPHYNPPSPPPHPHSYEMINSPHYGLSDPHHGAPAAHYGLSDPHHGAPAPHFGASGPSYGGPAPSYGTHQSYEEPHYEPTPCYHKTIYTTIHKTKVDKIPVYSTIIKPKYIPTTKYETYYTTNYETKYVPEYVPQYITETKYVNKYHTKTDLKTVYKTSYESLYYTETKYKPQYITKTAYVTQYETRYQPQYITETKIEPVHKTKVVYKTEVLYQTKYIEKPVTYKSTQASGYGHEDYNDYKAYKSPYEHDSITDYDSGVVGRQHQDLAEHVVGIGKPVPHIGKNHGKTGVMITDDDLGARLHGFFGRDASGKTLFGELDSFGHDDVSIHGHSGSLSHGGSYLFSKTGKLDDYEDDKGKLPLEDTNY